MQSETKYTLLRDAIAIVRGIPSRRFNLNVVRRNNRKGERHRDAHHCGTVGCVMGWLSLHPQFNALGLTAGYHQADLVLDGTKQTFDAAAAALFGITHREARDLFGPVGDSFYDLSNDDHAAPKGHRAVLRNRVRKFLESKGEKCAW